MEVVIELPDDFNKLCRTCMAIVENETSFDHFIFKENQTTKICYLLNSLINTKVSKYDYHCTFVKMFFFFLVTSKRWFTSNYM